MFVLGMRSALTSSRVPWARSLWHTRYESANSQSMRSLALGQPECQPAPTLSQCGVRPQDFAALLTPEGQGLLDRLSREYDEPGALALAARLRRDRDPGLVSAALTQAALRRRAAAKFGADAGVMYFTGEALEQATPGPVAAHRATRFREHGLSTVVDLGCGIGGDLVALARAGIAVTGVDRDPLRVAIARANLAALGLPGEVRAGDA